MSEKQNTLTYLSASNLLKFKFDKLITSHNQVQHLTNRFIQKFLYPSMKNEKDKVVLNINDIYNSNNNSGFNLTNFKVKFINQYFQDVIMDYEKSIIGTFTKSLIDTINLDEQLKDSIEIYFTITKFENDYGYSLVHQEGGPEENEDGNIRMVDENNQDILSNNQDDAINLSQQNLENSNLNFNSQTELQNNPDLSPQAQREEYHKLKRKAALNKHGVIPEFIKISEIYQVYTAFTQANLKNSILHQKKALKQAQLHDSIDNKETQETELKEDLIVIQFKLIDKKSFKTNNTFTFINVPLSKQSDNNVNTLLEILKKFRKQQNQKHTTVAKKKGGVKADFLPFNKSILTRVMAQQLQKHNIICLSHFSKTSVVNHFKNSTGPAKNLFCQIENIFGEDNGILTKKKLNHQQALKMLQSKFKKETSQIFNQLDQFREGSKSMEVYTQQTAAQQRGERLSVQPNMFNQILNYLNFKDEII